MASFTVGKKGKSDETKVVFVALEKSLKVKIIPGNKTEPYWVNFSENNGAYIPKNSLELSALRSRISLSKDLVEIDIAAVEKLIAPQKESLKK